MACPACSQPVPDGARFCPQCGTPLGASSGLLGFDSATDEERRIVTVVFADLVGFTSLAEHRDPEQVKRLVDAAFARLVADIEFHGGAVDKVLGDAIVALFGAPVAHEDDPDRAVRAALAMQATLRAFREEHPDDDVRLRIGVNTGEVLVGTVAGTDYTAMGDVVNTAARLQQLASPGAVLVGDATKQLCSPTLRFRAHDHTQLRGRDGVTQVWQAVTVDTATVARRWQSDVPFVGRGTELGVLDHFIDLSLGGRSAIVAVSGEAGIGKSRLVHEAIGKLVAQHPNTLLLEGVCAPYGESNVWWPVAGGLLARIGLDRNEPADVSRRRAARRLSTYDELDPGTPDFERSVEVAMHLLGHPSVFDGLGPATTRDVVFDSIARGLRRRAAKSPVVLWIDDLQWAAPLLLELLEAVARQLAGLPVLVVGTYRRSDDGLTDWPGPVDEALTLHLPLSPLSPVESRNLAITAARRVLPEHVLDSIAVRAGGNPLFIAELARLAASHPDHPDGGELPGSLRALIAARLDQLTPAQRALLDNAAILGGDGRVVALRDFAAELGQPFEQSDLDALDDAGLLVLDGGSWQFRSDVVREVAYSTLTKQARAQRHAGVAKHLEGLGDALLDLRAHHAAAAAELVADIGATPGVPDDIADVATRLLLRTARRWHLQGAHRRCVQLVERALSLETDTDAHREAMLVLAEGLVETHSLSRARDVLDDVSAAAAAAGDRVMAAEVWRLRGTIAQMEGDLVAARRELGRAVGEFRELDDPVHLAEALRARGFAEVFGGSLSDAEWFLGEADALFERLGDRRGRAWVQQHRAWVSFLNGDHDASRERLASSITAFEQLGDREGVSWARGLLAYVHHFNRRNAEADELAAVVYDEAKRWGDDWGAAMMLNLQASIRLWSGEIDAARSLAERSLTVFRRIDDRFGVIQALGTLNRALVALGKSAEAERSVEEIMVLADSFGEMAFPAMAAAGASMHAGRGERAAALATDAVGRLDITGASVHEGRVVLAFGRLLSGDPESALAELEQVPVDHSPFALAARATAHAMLGDAAAALADVAAVEAIAGEPDANVSYWDLWMARVAGLAVSTGAESAWWSEAARSELDQLADVVVRAYANDVLSRRTTASPPATPAPRGWAGVAAAMVPA
jgi:class 3 adenylate cyclase/tetratricopeptide (TPR) repeat protein